MGHQKLVSVTATKVFWLLLHARVESCVWSSLFKKFNCCKPYCWQGGSWIEIFSRNPNNSLGFHPCKVQGLSPDVDLYLINNSFFSFPACNEGGPEFWHLVDHCPRSFSSFLLPLPKARGVLKLIPVDSNPHGWTRFRPFRRQGGVCCKVTFSG